MRAVAVADQVVAQGVTHNNAKITFLDQGKLQFRTSEGSTVSAWIDEVQLILVDRGGIFDDFNSAEQFLHEGDPLKAIARYERTLRLTQEFWADLIACRLAMAHDRARQIDRTAQYFVRVLNGEFSGLQAAARLYPKSMPEKRDARVARAIDLLAEESRKSQDDSRRALIDVLRFDILIRTEPAASKSFARNIADKAIPAAARIPAVYEVILQAMQVVRKEWPSALTFVAVDRALRDCPEESLPGFLLLKGQMLLEASKDREQIIRAAWAFLRVPIHMPDHPLAPQALVEAAKAMEKLGKPEMVERLLAEAHNHPKATADVRSATQRGLKAP